MASNSSNPGMLSHSFAGQLMVNARKQHCSYPVQHHKNPVTRHAKAASDVGDFGILAVAQVEDLATAALNFFEADPQGAASGFHFGFDSAKGVFELHEGCFAQ